MKKKPMGKIVRLHSQQYQDQLKETRTRIEDFAEQLFEDAINIAAHGKWQLWTESMKEGDHYNFSEDMLLATDDKNIHAVLNIRDTVLEMMKRIK